MSAADYRNRDRDRSNDFVSVFELFKLSLLQYFRLRYRAVATALRSFVAFRSARRSPLEGGRMNRGGKKMTLSG